MTLQDNSNYLSLYYRNILSGHTIVSKKVKCQVAKLVHLIEYPAKNFIVDHSGEKEYFVYNQAYADRVIAFIETFCRHIKGSEFAGKPLKLELWQKAIISALYGFISARNRTRRFQRLHLYVGRKNGKTLLAACLILYELLLGGEAGAECYSGATKYAQAKICWDMARLIIKQNPALDAKFRCTISGIYTRPYSDSWYQPISKESKKLDGLSGHMLHIDELHAITDTNIIDVMWDSTKSRLQPIELITTTMGTERLSTFDEIYEYDANVLDGIFDDDRLLVFCYELDDISEWKDIRNAFKANPNLGVSHSINNLYAEIEKAKNDTSRQINLLCKSFNVRQTTVKSWLRFDDFNNEETIDIDNFRDCVVIGGFDLSRTGDMTAFTTMLFDKARQKIITHTMYWITRKYFEAATKVPFAKWVQQGLVRISGDTLINYRDIVEYVKDNYMQRGWRYMYINYDAWSAAYLIEDLSKLGYAKGVVLIPTPQGAKTLSIPMQELEANLKDKIVIYQNNPVTKWCFSNAEVEVDRNGNLMLKKGGYERKIDGVATILNCYVSLIKNKEYFLASDD